MNTPTCLVLSYMGGLLWSPIIGRQISSIRAQVVKRDVGRKTHQKMAQCVLFCIQSKLGDFLWSPNLIAKTVVKSILFSCSENKNTPTCHVFSNMGGLLWSPIIGRQISSIRAQVVKHDVGRKT